MVESYNSRYPLARYEIGKVYSFYAKPANYTLQKSEVPKYVTPAWEAHDQYIEQYGKVLSSVEDERGQYVGNTAMGPLLRFNGVVVEKIEGSGSSPDKIRVLVKQGDSYGEKLYAVGIPGVRTDEWELLDAKTNLGLNEFLYENPINLISEPTNIEITGELTKKKKKAEEGELTKKKADDVEGELTKKDATPTEEGELTKK